MNPTETYYAAFKRRHGFADSAMRGQERNIIVAKPVGAHAVDGLTTPDKFSTGMRPARPLSARPKELAHTIASADRANTTSGLLEALADLHPRVAFRISSRRTGAAIRDAVLDAEAVLRGEVPAAKGADLADVLRSLVRVLSRHA